MQFFHSRQTMARALVLSERASSFRAGPLAAWQKAVADATNGNANDFAQAWAMQLAAIQKNSSIFSKTFSEADTRLLRDSMFSEFAFAVKKSFACVVLAFLSLTTAAVDAVQKVLFFAGKIPNTFLIPADSWAVFSIATVSALAGIKLALFSYNRFVVFHAEFNKACDFAEAVGKIASGGQEASDVLLEFLPEGARNAVSGKLNAIPAIQS